MLHEKLIILAFGNICSDTPDRLHRRFLAVYDAPQIVIDLSGVETLDPLFLRELAKLKTHRRERNLQLGRLVVDSQYVSKALRAVGFDRSCPIYPTLEEAIASFDEARTYA